MIRLASAAVLAPILWLLIKRSPQWCFVSVAAALIAVACLECFRLVGRSGAAPLTALGVLTALGFVWSLSGVPGAPELGIVLSVAVAAITVGAMARRPDAESMVRAAGATLFPAVLVGLGLAYLVAVRALPGEDGPDLLLLLFLCVIISDAAAYYVGRTLGRRRLAPSISPGKTWAGAFAGVAGGIVAGLLAHFWFYQRLPLLHALILGAAVAMVGMGGDLAESMLKRAAGAKDSSSLIPGHGGLLDRADSLLFAGPFIYYYHRWFL